MNLEQLKNKLLEKHFKLPCNLNKKDCLDLLEIYNTDLIKPLDDEELEKILDKTIPNYKTMKVSELRKMAKQKGCTGYSKMVKSQLINEIKQKSM